jgi:MoaA/NifB/PqqE/SkfB family radical SAM enzyme
MNHDDLVEGHLPKFFCPRLWNEVYVQNSGALRPCCLFRKPLKFEDADASIYSHRESGTWDPAYNGPHMRELREAALSGARVQGCETCYEIEKAGGKSARTASLELAGDPTSVLANAKASVSVAHPTSIMLEFGNICNLRCRMCRPTSSSRIASDPVHREFLFKNYPAYQLQYELATALKLKQRWHMDREFCDSGLPEMLMQANELKIVGGEPLLNEAFLTLCKALIRRGRARNINICITTNGTLLSDDWVSILRSFRHVMLNVSIDGVGKLNDYIRDGSCWADVDACVRAAKAAGFAVQIISALQAYNFCDTHLLVKYALDQGCRWSISWVSSPACFDVAQFPIDVRYYFADELKRSLMPEDSPFVREQLRYCVERVESGPDCSAAWVNWNKFVEFTSTLDEKRGQSIAEAAPIVAALIDQLGEVAL